MENIEKMTTINPYHKKKNLFAFFKSKEFNEARVKMCALYVIISYANELQEDVSRLESRDGTKSRLSRCA